MLYPCSFVHWTNEMRCLYIIERMEDVEVLDALQSWTMTSNALDVRLEYKLFYTLLSV